MSIDAIWRILVMIVGGGLGTQLGVAISDYLEFEGGYQQAVVLAFMFFGSLTGLGLAPWLTSRPAHAVRLWISRRSSLNLLGLLIGLLVGLLMSALFTVPLAQLPPPFNEIGPILATVALTYVAVLIFSNRAEEIFRSLRLGRMVDMGGIESHDARHERRVLLDTSVIIDGRIADVSKLGFIGGTLVVPRFILAELQHIADSADTLRRNRGRRGLEILNRMQQDEQYCPVEIIDDDIEGVREADEKLVLLARKWDVPVMTNDYNLNRVAELQGVTVLNINELANAVKAVYLPGETMTIHVLQEGKEVDQGVGYLEDGTMVVIERGRYYIDRTIEVEVTKHIQTPAGRMIFARPTGMDQNIIRR